MTKVFNKKTAKRAVSVVLLLLIVFSSIFVLPITAAAKSYTIKFDYCYDTSNNIIKFVKKTTNDGYVVGEVGEELCRIKADGKDAYCIQPGHTLKSGNTLTEDASAAWKGMSDAKRKAINLALLFGKSKNKAGLTGTDGQQWIATQMFVWEFATGCRATSGEYKRSNAKYFKGICSGDNNPGVKNDYNKIANKSFENILKKFKLTVTKKDVEKTSPQGDASLAGAIYGIYKADKLIDKYVTDNKGQFTTKEYVCDTDWTVKEIKASEGYLLNSTVYKVGAEPKTYTVEHNTTSLDVTEQVIKGRISIIKHTDNGETQIETPEKGAEFEVYLKSAGSYSKAKDTEKDNLVCDDNGYAQTKLLPYGTYTVHQTKSWDGRDLVADFDVYIAENEKTYNYIINNRNFESYIKIVKLDSETNKVIPYENAGFKLYDPDGKLIKMSVTYPKRVTIDTFYTNSEGYLTCSLALILFQPQECQIPVLRLRRNIYILH